MLASQPLLWIGPRMVISMEGTAFYDGVEAPRWELYNPANAQDIKDAVEAAGLGLPVEVPEPVWPESGRPRVSRDKAETIIARASLPANRVFNQQIPSGFEQVGFRPTGPECPCCGEIPGEVIRGEEPIFMMGFEPREGLIPPEWWSPMYRACIEIESESGKYRLLLGLKGVSGRREFCKPEAAAAAGAPESVVSWLKELQAVELIKQLPESRAARELKAREDRKAELAKKFGLTLVGDQIYRKE